MKTREIDPEDMALLSAQFTDLYEKSIKQAIAETGQIIEIPEGEILIDIGQYIKMMPLILSGSLKILREDNDGRELLLYHVHEGQTCAMSITCCMGDAKSSVRAIAEENTKMIALPTRIMDEWSNQYPSWKHFIMRTYQKRFEELLHTIDSIAFQKLDDRLEKWLKEKISKSEDGTIHITHQEIASELHSSREVISRLLKKMEHQGLLDLGRNKIKMR
jgi:CRP/FNR family transcriptional regulator, anaerobic regulatory protein